MPGDLLTDDSLHIVLYGRTGSGKTATGETIVGNHCFLKDSNDDQNDNQVVMAKASIGNIKVTVAEIPDLNDASREGQVEIMKRVTSEVGGIDVLAITMAFPFRYTIHEQATTGLIQEIFKDEFIRNHCILVATCGDSFEAIQERNNMSFQEWCHGQTGLLQELFQQVQHRVVLFYNKGAKYTSKRKEGLEKFISFAKDIKANAKRYAVNDCMLFKTNNPCNAAKTIESVTVRREYVDSQVRNEHKDSHEIGESLKIKVPTLQRKAIASEENDTQAGENAPTRIGTENTGEFSYSYIIILKIFTFLTYLKRRIF